MATEDYKDPFGRFCKSCLKRAYADSWTFFGFLRGYAHAAQAVVYICGPIGGISAAANKGSPRIMSACLLICLPTAIWLISLLVNLAKAPRSVFLELETKRKTDIDEKQSKINDLSKELETKRNEKYDKASSEITQHIMSLSERYSVVSGWPKMAYKPDDDNDTVNALARIHGWVFAELNQDGKALWCSGALEIHGSDLLANQGSTIFDRNQAETEARLKRRMDNLRAIKDNINKYLT